MNRCERRDLDEIDAFSLRAFIRLDDEHRVAGRFRRLNDHQLLLLLLLVLMQVTPRRRCALHHAAAAAAAHCTRLGRRRRRRRVSQGVAELGELLRQEPRARVKAVLVGKQAAQQVERSTERHFAHRLQHTCTRTQRSDAYLQG